MGDDRFRGTDVYIGCWCEIDPIAVLFLYAGKNHGSNFDSMFDIYEPIDGVFDRHLRGLSILMHGIDVSTRLNMRASSMGKGRRTKE